MALVRNIGLSLVADIYPVLTDHLGTPRKVLDDTGAPQWTWDAKDPYGHQMPDQLVGGSTFVFSLRFPGQRYDSETGLFHNGFRDYNPATGRYVQADPIGLEGGWNPYAYTGASPIMYADPYGLYFVYDDPSVQASFERAFARLEKSPTATAAISRVMDSDDPYHLVVGDKTGFYLDAGTNYISWNRNLAALCVVTGNVVSPTILLAHEFGHADRYDRGLIPVYGKWGAAEWIHHNTLARPVEESIVFKMEQKISQEMGEKPRWSYYLSTTVPWRNIK